MRRARQSQVEVVGGAARLFFQIGLVFIDGTFLVIIKIAIEEFINDVFVRPRWTQRLRFAFRLNECASKVVQDGIPFVIGNKSVSFFARDAPFHRRDAQFAKTKVLVGTPPSGKAIRLD